ncbi:MAG: hypothetical protein B9S34_11825 [Opitutia bacterium Tous-C1TDCM]|nr:MAG: hypothetical protein B9S34_11825 [Opitutae bacterium Tous-C1TDCM]
MTAMIASRLAPLLLLLVAPPALAQTRPAAPAETRFQRFERMSREAEKTGLAEPFRGITADGKVEPGLFSVKSTGVTTAPVVAAAQAFLAALTPAQRAKTAYPVGDDEWRKWMNQHFYLRQGVSFLEMSPAQREAAFGLMRASLSARGLKLSQDIMKLNRTLGELNRNDFEQYNEWLYHVTVMGEPSATKPWGWQVDGHHLIVNYFVLGDQVVMSPLFVGSEPVVAASGQFKGTVILQDEQNRGRDFLLSLDPAQRAKAVLGTTKTANHTLTEAFRDNVVIPYAGLPGRDLNAAQRRDLLALIGLYVGNLADGHAKIKMDEVAAHLDRTHFAWLGGSAADSVYYYRIHSPVLLVEFDHQRPAGLRHVKDPAVPNREHIHIVVRTPNGNDYGKDLLRQHLAAHPH